MRRLAAQVILLLYAPAPTFLFMALCDGAPPTIERLDTPDMSADQGPIRPIGEDQSNNFNLPSPAALHCSLIWSPA